LQARFDFDAYRGPDAGREFIEVPLSLLQAMTNAKKAGPKDGPAFGAHIGGRRLAVVSGDLDFA